MRVVVVYESMYGNTHRVAEAIAVGLALGDEVAVMPVSQIEGQPLDDTELIIVGGPTHVHGMSRPRTREAAVDAARKPEATVVLEPDAESAGLREWLASLGHLETKAAAFDTRIKAPAVLSGQASRGISKSLRQHGMSLVAEPESFLVTKENHLVPGEEERARAWGRQLATTIGA
jgi:menaquinone-dependent protoporphyrinogen IX oxidase